MICSASSTAQLHAYMRAFTCTPAHSTHSHCGAGQCRDSNQIRPALPHILHHSIITVPHNITAQLHHTAVQHRITVVHPVHGDLPLQQVWNLDVSIRQSESVLVYGAHAVVSTHAVSFSSSHTPYRHQHNTVHAQSSITQPNLTTHTKSTRLQATSIPAHAANNCTPVYH